MNNQECKRLWELCDGATPGPWYATRSQVNDYNQIVRYVHRLIGDDNPMNRGGTPNLLELNPSWTREVDAAFIAAARTALPALLAERGQLRRRLHQAHVEVDIQRNEVIRLRAEVTRLEALADDVVELQPFETWG